MSTPVHPTVKLIAKYRRYYGLIMLIPFLFAAEPTGKSIWFGLFVMAAGMLMRVWASGFIFKDNKLAVEGPYSIVRNPLYFGSYVMGAGCMIGGNTPILLLLYLITYPIVYICLIMTEEVRLTKLFGESYTQYCHDVPRLFPNPFLFRPGKAEWSFGLTFIDHKEYVTGAAILLITLFLWVNIDGDEPPMPLPEPEVQQEMLTREVVSAPVKVAAIQFISVFGNTEANIEGLTALIREAAANNAKIIVLPETAVQGYMTQDIKTTWHIEGKTLTRGLNGVSPAPIAQTVPGPITDIFSSLSDELDIYLTIPVLETDPKTGRYFNALVLAGPEGSILAHYRKRNPWLFAERGWATSGDRGLAYADTPYGRLGLLICYDINTEPPAVQAAGVDILLYSIAWVDSENSTWYDKELPAIAKSNNLHIIGANWTVKKKPDWFGYGQSRIIDKNGKILAQPESDLGNAILYADIPGTSQGSPSEQ